MSMLKLVFNLNRGLPHSGVIQQCLETFLVATVDEGYYWPLVSREWKCC